MSSDNPRMRPASIHHSQMLQGVSRSFALSIRLLPQVLREPVGWAYLLARLTDTVADTATQPVSLRLQLLDALQQAIEQGHLPPDLPQAMQDFSHAVTDPHEQALLQRGSLCLQAMHTLPAGDQAAIRSVLAAITEGQRWDLCALDSTGPGVQTQAEVDRYTWLVAGSVGEFWTRLCELHLHHWHRSPAQDMRRWGAAYGQGLQRLNILRDAHADLQSGRCYFPAPSLAAHGWTREALCAAVRSQDRAQLQAMAPLLAEWQDQTEALLHDGLRYSLALRPWRLRLASALPCLIGIRTLALLRQAGPQALVQHIKLPRAQVRRLLWTLVLTGASPRQLQRRWQEGLVLTDQTSARIGP